jgi:hypothetical protein
MQPASLQPSSCPSAFATVVWFSTTATPAGHISPSFTGREAGMVPPSTPCCHRTRGAPVSGETPRRS